MAMTDVQEQTRSGPWERLEAYAGQERFLIGASVWRIVAGCTILIEYLINYGQRRYLHGPDALYPFDSFAQTRPFSLFAWSSSPLYFELCFHAAILVAILWTLGWRTRWLTPLNFVFWYSLQQRFPGLWDGGDNIMRLALLYSMFANVSAHFSMDAARREEHPAPSRPTLEKTSAMFHNAAMLAFALQLGLMYEVAGLAKVQGEMWRQGTAIYYSLRGGQYVWPGFSEAIYRQGELVSLLSHATVLFQVSFPFLLFMNRYARLGAILVGVSFHVGIALFMGLITFSLFMMAVDLALIDDEEYRMMGRWIGRAVERVKHWSSARSRSENSPAQVET